MVARNGILEQLEEGGIVFDGGMGSMLIADGLPSGAPPEEWNRSKPAAVSRVHESYVEAGARVISTNTFGGTPGRLAEHQLGDEVESLNGAGVRLARSAVDGAADRAVRFVALSVGPTGKMLPPVGRSTEAEVRDEFLAQVRAVKEPIDLVLVETMFDLREAMLALDAAKSVLPGPVAVCLTYNRKPKGFFTVMGDAASEATRKLEDAGADIVGANCSISSGDMIELAPVLRRSTTRPVLCQPNAGNPEVKSGIPVYKQTLEEFADDGMRLFESGINAVGGCCGTTPAFIGELVSRMRRR